MSSEIRLAFAHPSERSEATATAPRDRISVRDYMVDVEIGAFQAERGVTQRISFNIVVEVRALTGPIDDDVDRILSYDKITEAVQFELAEERLNLLETVAERVADRILLEPQAMKAFVRVEKLDRGPYALGVEIVRERAAAAPGVAEEDTPHPEIVYLSNAAIASANLTSWIDQLEARGKPRMLNRHRRITRWCSAGLTCWRLSRTLGCWRAVMRAAKWWARGRSLIGPCATGKSAFGRRRKSCWTRLKAPVPNPDR